MADTQTLMALVAEFPEAFANPEVAGACRSTPTTPTSAVPYNSRIEALLALQSEFPEAFADLAIAPPAVETAMVESMEAALPVGAVLPNGFELSLNRTISTFTWGTIEAHLKYSATGLVSLWLVAGKSGTEIQSLCEAICRLTNLLLAHQVPIAEIVKELRGIRGADSEGFGPHRMLGLADLIGKVLQEAPARLSGTMAAPMAAAAIPVQDAGVERKAIAPRSEEAGMQHGSASLSGSLLDLSDNNQRMSLCPECGSELQAMNGCAGGACQVCGYSSCS